MQRRIFLQAAMLACAMPSIGFAKSGQPVIEVFKSATCGCCTQWVDHLRANGFKVNETNVPNTAAYRTKLAHPPLPYPVIP